MRIFPALLAAAMLAFAPMADADAKKAKPQPGAAVAAGTVSMNTSSKKFHEQGCRYFDCKNCVRVTRAEAERQGGVPCKKCH